MVRQWGLEKGVEKTRQWHSTTVYIKMAQLPWGYTQGYIQEGQNDEIEAVQSPLARCISNLLWLWK